MEGPIAGVLTGWTPGRGCRLWSGAGVTKQGGLCGAAPSHYLTALPAASTSWQPDLVGCAIQWPQSAHIHTVTCEASHIPAHPGILMRIYCGGNG